MEIKQIKIFYGEVTSVEDKTNEYIKQLELSGRGITCLTEVKQCAKQPSNVLATIMYKEIYEATHSG